MKRILCIVGGMNAGGAETYLMKLYRKFDRNYYQMDFAVTIPKEGFYDKEILALGGQIFHIAPKTVNIFKNYLNIYQIVKKGSYLSVLRTSQHSLSALELLAAWQGGARIRIFRSSNSNTTTESGFDYFLHRSFRFMPNLFANVRIAPSEEAARFMFGEKSIRKGKVTLLKNGIDLNEYKYSVAARKQVREEFGISTNFVVGHIGRFSKQKNHEFLIKVFSEIKKEEETAILCLVGVGELENEIRDKINEYGLGESVIFTGTRNDIPEILSAFDIFVFPSLYEGMPNTVIEAQATGLYCVVSNMITREANITGNVYYLPLDSSPIEWMNEILEHSKRKRYDPSRSFIERGYIIDDVSKYFCDLAFGSS